MNFLVCTLFVVIFLIEYVTGLGIVSRYAILIPEMFSAIAVLMIFARLVAGRGMAIRSKYLAALGVLALIMLIGIVAQGVASGTIIAGMRGYLKYLPFFLLPAVYDFSDRQLKVQFSVLAVLLVIQTPLTVYQRFVEYVSRMHTGDYIIGTLSTASSLSLLVMCAIAMIMVLYLRRKIGIFVMAVCAAVILVPATINETKATLLLFPVVLIAPMFFMPNRRVVLRKFLPIVAMGSLALVVFVGVYDYLATFSPYTQSVSEYLTDDESATTFYLYTGASSIDQYGYVGRADSLVLAYQHALQDPFRFAFGLGIGNVNTSVVSSFSGEYAVYGVRHGSELTQISHFIWEVGFLGLALYLMIFFMMYRDARWLASRNDFMGILGQFWSTSMLVMVFALLYARIFDFNEIGYIFWFYSGLVASKRYRLSRKEATETAASAPARSDELEDSLTITSSPA
ncbi:MAG: hypothetical protein ACR2QQ_10960 [Gammaproteobacteria bacterium]